MLTISTTIEFKGYKIKISNNKVYVPQFGTTYLNINPHWSYCEVPIEHLTPLLRQKLKELKLIK